MKLILVGFSEQDANVIKIYCQRSFDKFDCIPIKRQFSKSMQLMLPILPPAVELNADAYMISLEGVGMSQHRPVYKAKIEEFTGGKPCVLVSRRGLQEWCKLDPPFSDCRKILYLSMPYSRDSMQETLVTLLHLVKDTAHNKKLTIKPVPNTKNDYWSPSYDDGNLKRTIEAHERVADSPKPIQPVDTLEKVVQNSEGIGIFSDSIQTNSETRILDKALRQYFPALYDISLTRNMLTIWSQIQPIKLVVGSYVLLMQPTKRSALIDNDHNKVIDYLGIVGGHLRASSKHMTTQLLLLTHSSYEHFSKKLLGLGYKQYPLNTLLWQIADNALQKDIKFSEHSLSMKVKYLPNFAIMPFVPSYVYPVMSACLAKPRTIKDLHALFPQLDLKELNRLMVIAMLSGIVDTKFLFEKDVLLQSVQAKGLKDKKSDTIVVNDGIKKAQKTGFFKRLLRKLSL